MPPTQHQKGADFRALHDGDPFVIPNPWDAGSAKVLAGLGFKALASTSSGFAFTLGRPDGAATLDEVVEHTGALDRATSLPVSVDLENGYGRTAAGRRAGHRPRRRRRRRRRLDRGLRRRRGIYPLEEAAERVAAAVEAARGLDFEFTLTARAENHIRGNPDLEDTIARLQAYERAGADVLYAPGLRSGEEIRAVCDAVSKPVNVLAHRGLSLSEIVEAGGQRISVGGALTWVAVGALVDAAEQIRDHGDFSVSLRARRVSRRAPGRPAGASRPRRRRSRRAPG